MIISIGEVVWDIFKDQQVLGGAPINVAYHLRSLSVAVKIITRIGTDNLGAATLKRITELGLPVEGVQKDTELPTGRVLVTIDEADEPNFDIIAPAAWDNIDAEEAERFACSSAKEGFHLVFGTLAQRQSATRAAIKSLWQKADQKFYDVNLRPPFTGKELVLDSLAAADIVKMNRSELDQIAGWSNIDISNNIDSAREAAQKLRNIYNLKVTLVTDGSAGAWLLCDDGLFTDHGRPVEVADTVGAGDAFFATFIEGYINKRPWPNILARANQYGAYVASQHGATPPLPDELLVD